LGSRPDNKIRFLGECDLLRGAEATAWPTTTRAEAGALAANNTCSQ
jgi:hypothetical protein